jgi:DNA repair protein RecN (Recombination protein N)
MLRYLSVTDFALVRSAALELGPGLTVLTGETGAGKSILMDALGIVVGGRSSAISVRDGAAKAVIQASFEPPAAELVTAAGLGDVLGELSQDEVILVRELPRDGKGRATVDGRLLPVARVRELGELLADLHGQGDQQSLLSPSWQLRYLDGIAGLHGDTRELSARHDAMASAREERRRLAELARERDQRLAAMTFERDELRRAKLRAGEEEELQETRRLLGSREKVAELTGEGLALVAGAGDDGGVAGAVGLVTRLERVMGQLVRYRDALQPVAAAIPEVLERLRDVEGHLRSLQGRLEYDPAELDRVEGRLHELDRLRRKHGTDVAGLLGRLGALEAECAALTGMEERLRRADGAVAAAEEAFRSAALRARAARARAARDVEQQVEAILGDLALPAARVVLALSPKPPPAEGGLDVEGGRAGHDRTGIDDLEILVALNPGEAPRPLRKVASGGEISRLMLALKLLAARDEGPETLVFDEIDVGVSGRTAEAVGRKLRELARRKQVLCITHLPQVACFGHTHVEVRKRLENDRAVVDAIVLSEGERREALARLLAGAEVTGTARRHAEELLQRARES